MQRSKFIFGGFVLGAIAIAVALASNPLRRSEEKVAAWLQAQTPLGSNRAEVTAYIEKQRWPIGGGSDGRTQGEFVRAELGHYYAPLLTSVTVFWEFDSEAKLERIRVWKTVDAP